MSKPIDTVKLLGCALALAFCLIVWVAAIVGAMNLVMR